MTWSSTPIKSLITSASCQYAFCRLSSAPSFGAGCDDRASQFTPCLKQLLHPSPTRVLEVCLVGMQLGKVLEMARRKALRNTAPPPWQWSWGLSVSCSACRYGVRVRFHFIHVRLVLWFRNPCHRHGRPAHMSPGSQIRYQVCDMLCNLDLLLVKKQRYIPL
jgi:hypothetical protein